MLYTVKLNWLKVEANSQSEAYRKVIQRIKEDPALCVREVSTWSGARRSLWNMLVFGV